MRFKAGVVMGLATGYYLGTMAGRERYQQLNQMLERARRSDTFDAIGDKARAVVDLTIERARDLVDDARGNGSEPVRIGPEPSYSSSR